MSNKSRLTANLVSSVGVSTILDFNTDRLTISGVSTFTGNIDANGDLDVDGHTELDNLNVSGVSTFAGTADFNGDVDIDGRTELDITNISETLNVVGISTFASNVDINADIDIDGHTELDNLNVSGVTTTSQLNVGTGGTVFFTKNDGSIGIGTTDPIAKLEIRGGVTKDGGEGNLLIVSSDPTNIPSTITQGYSNGTLQVFGGGMDSGSRRGGQIDFIAGNAGTDPGTLIFRTGTASGGTSQSERLRITSDGKLGIGTDNPNSSLHVHGAAGSGDARIRISSIEGSGLSIRSLSATENNINADSNEDITFSSGGVLETLRITGIGGSVGINTTDPRRQFEVLGSVGLLGQTFIGGESVGTLFSYWSGSGVNPFGINDLGIPGSTFGSVMTAAGSGHHVFGLRENEGADSFVFVSGGDNHTSDGIMDTMLMTIRANGAIGIATHTPAAGYENLTVAARGDRLARIYLKGDRNEGTTTNQGGLYYFSRAGNELASILGGGTNTEPFINFTLSDSTSGNTVLSMKKDSSLPSGKGVGINTDAQNINAALDVYVAPTTYCRINEPSVALLNLQSSFSTAPLLKIDGTSTADLVQITDNGSPVFYIKDGGTVGVGTNNPSSSYGLELRGKPLRVYNASIGGSGVTKVAADFSNDQEGLQIIIGSDGYPSIRNGSSVDTLQLSSFGSIAMAIDSNNNTSGNYFTVYADGESGSGNILFQISETGAMRSGNASGVPGFQTVGDPAGGFKLAGDLNLDGHAIIASDGSNNAGNIDHFWHTDTSEGSPYNSGGTWHFVSDGSYKASGATGNSKIECEALQVGGYLAKGSGSFRIRHPLAGMTTTHTLSHSFIEGPRADLIYRGEVRLVSGIVTIIMDEAVGLTTGTWDALCRDPDVFVTNNEDWTPVKAGITSTGVLTIQAQDPTCTAKVNWLVIAERQDDHMFETLWTDENGRPILEYYEPLEQQPVSEEISEEQVGIAST